MGSSDVVCAVSHLPIQYREPCRFLFLRQVMTWDDELEPGTWEHAWARWLPLSLPVKGLYDGYGRTMAGWREDRGDHHAKYEPDPLLRFQVESLARVALPLPDDLRTGYGDLEDFPNTIESLMSACERGWLRVRLPRDRLRDDEEQTFQTLRVSPYYVSERAWQAMIAPADQRGIGGSWRRRLERQHGDVLGTLTHMIDHYREHPERRALRATASDGDALDEEAHVLIERSFPLTLRGLLPGHESMPDVAVVGGDWEPPLQQRDSLYTFKEADWTKFRELVLDLHVFTMTLRHELFRECHPELWSGQFYFPDTELIGPRMLLRYVEEWCQEMERQHLEDSDD